MQLHIIFDTSVLRNKTHQLLNSPEIQAITELAINSHILIHLPYIVEHEFKTNRFNGYKKRANQVSSKIRNLYNDNKGEEGEWFLKLNDIISNTDKIAKEKISYIDKWIEVAKIKKTNTMDSDVANVFEKYFAGELPFNSQKERYT